MIEKSDDDIFVEVKNVTLKDMLPGQMESVVQIQPQRVHISLKPGMIVCTNIIILKSSLFKILL